MSAKIKLPNLILLVGLPGSGKSYFSTILESSNPDKVVRISGDDLGSQAECEDLLIRSIRSKTCIIDKCNVTADSRAYWVTYAMVERSKVLVIWFDYPASECLSRVKKRVDHPSIKFGSGESVVKSFERQFEPPSESEGFGKIIKISTFHKANELLKAMGAKTELLELDASIVKFPRTHHIFDVAAELGRSGGSAVTRDDLLLDSDEIESYCNRQLTIEEKIDGANLGISIDDDFNIVYQNRSHYVTYETATQFKGLQNWEVNHSGDLFKILLDQNGNPGRYILYGEWCYAKHSILYSTLPDYFLAFDIFDKFENKFYSRQRFYDAVGQTGLSTVPTIGTICVQNVDELKTTLIELINSNSRYTDGYVEGVYIRKDDPTDRFLESRCKLVRPEFTQAIDTHWSKMELEKNTVIR